MLPQAAETMPLGTSGVPTSVAASGSAPADYQREYEAMREWAYPHQHYWEYSPKKHNGGYVCLGCWSETLDPWTTA